MRLTLLLACLFSVIQCFAWTELSVSQLTDSLDKYLKLRENLLTQQNDNIARLRQKISTQPDSTKRSSLYMELALAYEHNNVDSTIYYYDLASNMAQCPDDHQLYVTASHRRDAIMPLAGVSKEAVDDFESLQPVGTDSAAMADYFRSGAKMYNNISKLYDIPSVNELYHRKAIVMLDSLIKYIPGTLESKVSNALKLIYQGKSSESLAELMEILPLVKNDPVMAAYVTKLLADYYKDRPGIRDAYLHYLLLTAIAEAKCGYANIEPLPTVSSELMKKNAWRRSYRYMQMALRDAVASGSKADVMQCGKDIRYVSERFCEKNRLQLTWLMIFIGILVAALIAIMFMLVRLHRDRKRQQQLQQHLEESNASKDVYIRNILSLCSDSMERLEDFNRLVGRKIKAGQIQDLYSAIESGKFIQQQTEQFYTNFDEAFLCIYPDFIQNVNALLQPEKRYKDVTRRSLTPELRILAFMLLGVDESAKVAQFLGLSVNTIYTYRNRMKSRALNRDDFEQNLKLSAKKL